MSRRKTVREFRNLPKDFEGLVRAFPPRAIHDKAGFENTVEMVDLLAGHRLTKGQRDYLDTLAILVERYEEVEFFDFDNSAGPLDVLRFLMDEHGMNGGDLGRLLGNRTLGYAILKGDRELSKTHVRTLAEHFCLNPGVFL